MQVTCALTSVLSTGRDLHFQGQLPNVAWEHESNLLLGHKSGCLRICQYVIWMYHLASPLVFNSVYKEKKKKLLMLAFLLRYYNFKKITIAKLRKNLEGRMYSITFLFHNRLNLQNITKHV